METSRPHVVVTGAGRGIGESVARVFADNGYEVTAVDIRFGWRPESDLVRHRLLDIADRNACSEFGESIDSLNVLVNAAAVRPEAPLISQDWEGLTRAIEVNLVGPFVLMQTLVPRMPDGGAVVNVSSAAAYGKSHLAAYGATKAALISIGATAALELSDRGIRVNTILPGTTDTPMVAELLHGTPMPAAGTLRNLGGRLLTPAEVAATIMRIAEEPQVTGAVIPVGLLPATW